MIQTQTTGIAQVDVILRSALQAAFDNVRSNPWLLDFAFAGLKQDPLTNKLYGDAEVARAKEWFLANKVTVYPYPRKANAPLYPCVTVRQLSKTEAEVTLADLNYETTEFSDEQPPLSAPFDPVAYDHVTGELTAPPTLAQNLVVVPGMLVAEAFGGPQHEIQEVDDDVLTIDPGITADLRGATIVGAKPASAVSIEGVENRHTFRVGAYVHGEPAYLLWLQSIVEFCLLTYKQDLLEARGFERTVLSGSEPDRLSEFEAENVYARALTITGYARDFWPKNVALTVSGLGPMRLTLDGANLYPTGSPADAEVVGELDGSAADDDD